MGTQRVVLAEHDLRPPARALSTTSGAEETDPANSVMGKVRLILEAFSLDDDELSLSELVQRTGIAKATAHRLCMELLRWGVLDRSGSRYRLGLRLFEIGQRVATQRILRDSARPYMEDLLRESSVQAVHLAARSGLDVLYIEKLTGHGRVSPSQIAGRMPLYCTATGKAILAFSEPWLVHEVAGAGLRRRTAHTCTSAAKLQRDLAQIRVDGIATEMEEVRLGYTSVAVPLFTGSGTVIGAMSVTMPTYRADARRCAGILRPAGQSVTRALRGYEI